MIRNVTEGVPASVEDWPEKLERFKKIKEALDRDKRGLPPQDDIKLEDIPF